MIASNRTSYPNVILGLGVTGLSVAKFLKSQNLEYLVMDSRENPPGKPELMALDPDVSLISGKFDAEIIKKAKRLIVNPGLSINKEPVSTAKAQGLEVIGDIELFAREVKKRKFKLVGITGSNGKSTVVSLLKQMAKEAGLKAFMGGNIGTPALNLLLEPEVDLIVLELSSFQLETTCSLNCDVAAILNISQDHLDRYASFDDYIKAKKKILKQTQTIVLWDDDAILKHLGHKVKNRIGFTLDSSKKHAEYGLMQAAGETWLVKGKQKLISSKSIYLKGRHNFLNALAALALGSEIGLPLGSMQKVLKEFKGLAHRCQLVRELDGVKWINDSKGTNIGASVAAINGLSARGQNNLILLAGGQAKDGDFTKLAQAAKNKVRQVLIFGEDADLVATELKKVTKVHRVLNLEDAVVQARRQANAGDTVLLSPACASFDMFVNYQARGDKFIELVEALS